MKKYITLLAVCTISLSMVHGQIAFLQRVADVATYPAEDGEHPEKQAYEWFKSTYAAQGKGATISPSDVLTITPATYPVLWVNVDAVGLTDLAAAGIDNAVITAISNYVKAGGNLLLTKQASCIATEIGRMGVKDNGDKYFPTWGNGGYSEGVDTWSVNAQIGVGVTLRDARRHPIFDGMTDVVINDYAHESFPLVGAVKRTDNNNMWIELERKNGEARVGNDKIEQLNLFQTDWDCSILAVWGNVRDYCAPTIIEFHPQGDYKGSIITIGAAAYQWGTSNNYIANVKQLTANALNYLNHTGVEYGYMLPYPFTEIYSIDELRPDYNAAKWFYDNYVVTNRGRFVHRDEAIPTGMKVLWVNNDRLSQSTEVFYNDFGGDAFRDRLHRFVQDGGNVLLTKQATRFAYDINRCSWMPSYIQSAVSDANDTWYMTANFVGCGNTDRHEHPAFRYMTDYTENGGEGYCKWTLVSGEVPYKRTDHKYMWGEPGDVWANNYGISAGSTDKARIDAFESAQTARILGGWGHTTALDGVAMVEFMPTATFAGTLIAQGMAAYQWNSSNTCANIQNLTKGILEYLYNADTYTRNVTSGNYGTICLPRASAAFSGATFYRIAGKEMEGTNPISIVLEQVNTLESGVPYVFQATASTITVAYTDGATVTPDNSGSNGLIGSFDIAPIADAASHYILSENTLYPVNASKVGANRAYFDLSAMSEYVNTPSPAPLRRMYINRPSMPTTLEQATDKPKECCKVIEDGTLFILRAGVKYNTQGQVVKQ